MPWLTTRRLALAALAAWLAVAALNLALGPPLGHDEAAFAVIARGEQPPGTWLYRSDGTVALARLGIALGGAPWQLRLASALLGASIVAAAFAVGRAAFSARTGAWAAAVIAGAHPMALRSAQLLGDLPAAACVLGGIAALAGELDREAGPRWRIAAAAPLFAAAFYLRYGSAPAIAVALAAAGLVWRRAIAARPLPALGVLAALAALAVPHLVRSHGATGSALGILEVSAGMPRRAYLGEGLVTYLTSEPLRFYGVLVAPVMAVGLLGLVRTRRRAPWYLAIVALGQLVALGLQSHGQSRYVFVAVVLLSCSASTPRRGSPGRAWRWRRSRRPGSASPARRSRCAASSSSSARRSPRPAARSAAMPPGGRARWSRRRSRSSCGTRAARSTWRAGSTRRRRPTGCATPSRSRTGRSTWARSPRSTSCARSRWRPATPPPRSGGWSDGLPAPTVPAARIAQRGCANRAAHDGLRGRGMP